MWNPVGQNPTIPRQVLEGATSLLFVGNFSTWRATVSTLNQPYLCSELTSSRLWSRTGSRIRPPIHAFIDRLANHTQGTQNVLCGKLNFSKCVRSAGVIKPAGWSEEGSGWGNPQNDGWQGWPGLAEAQDFGPSSLGPWSSFAILFQQIITGCPLCAVLA